MTDFMRWRRKRLAELGLAVTYELSPGNLLDMGLFKICDEASYSFNE